MKTYKERRFLAKALQCVRADLLQCASRPFADSGSNLAGMSTRPSARSITCSSSLVPSSYSSSRSPSLASRLGRRSRGTSVVLTAWETAADCSLPVPPSVSTPFSSACPSSSSRQRATPLTLLYFCLSLIPTTRATASLSGPKISVRPSVSSYPLRHSDRQLF